jgi:hypothetical protein
MNGILAVILLAWSYMSILVAASSQNTTITTTYGPA